MRILGLSPKTSNPRSSVQVGRAEHQWRVLQSHRSEPSPPRLSWVLFKGAFSGFWCGASVFRVEGLGFFFGLQGLGFIVNWLWG